MPAFHLLVGKPGRKIEQRQRFRSTNGLSISPGNYQQRTTPDVC